MFRSIKNLFVLLCLLVMSMVAYSAVKVPGKVTFDGEAYTQAEQTKEDGYIGTAYLKNGLSLDGSTKVIVITEFSEITEVEELANKMVQNHKEEAPHLPRRMNLSVDKKEAVGDFIVTKGAYSEYSAVKILKKKNVVISYAYYFINENGNNKNSYDSWLDQLDENREKWAQERSKADFIK